MVSKGRGYRVLLLGLFLLFLMPNVAADDHTSDNILLGPLEDIFGGIEVIPFYERNSSLVDFFVLMAIFFSILRVAANTAFHNRGGFKSVKVAVIGLSVVLAGSLLFYIRSALEPLPPAEYVTLFSLLGPLVFVLFFVMLVAVLFFAVRGGQQEASAAFLIVVIAVLLVRATVSRLVPGVDETLFGDGTFFGSALRYAEAVALLLLITIYIPKLFWMVGSRSANAITNKGGEYSLNVPAVKERLMGSSNKVKSTAGNVIQAAQELTNNMDSEATRTQQIMQNDKKYEQEVKQLTQVAEENNKKVIAILQELVKHLERQGENPQMLSAINNYLSTTQDLNNAFSSRFNKIIYDVNQQNELHGKELQWIHEECEKFVKLKDEQQAVAYYANQLGVKSNLLGQAAKEIQNLEGYLLRGNENVSLIIRDVITKYGDLKKYEEEMRKMELQFNEIMTTKVVGALSRGQVPVATTTLNHAIELKQKQEKLLEYFDSLIKRIEQETTFLQSKEMQIRTSLKKVRVALDGLQGEIQRAQAAQGQNPGQ